MGRVIVVGSINLDVITLVDRIPLAGETVFGRAGGRGLGGKGANQAIAALRAGCDVRLVGQVGHDGVGDEVLAALAASGLALASIGRVDAPTGQAQILVGDGDNQIVVVPGANRAPTPASLADIAFRPGDICVAQLEVTVTAIAEAFDRARAAGARTMLNVAPADLDAMRALLPLTDIVVANESEWGGILGAPLDTAAPFAALLSAAATPALAGVKMLIATLGDRGIGAVAQGATIRVEAIAVPVVDTTGAGDCFCGYLAAALAEGLGLEDALRLANTAAALAVGHVGASASLPWRTAVDEFRTSRGQ